MSDITGYLGIYLCGCDGCEELYGEDREGVEQGEEGEGGGAVVLHPGPGHRVHQRVPEPEQRVILNALPV